MELILETEEKVARLEELLNRIENNQNLTYAEKYWVYESILLNAHYFKEYPETMHYWESKKKYLESEVLKDYKFFFLYIMAGYCWDINGYQRHKYHFTFKSEEFNEVANEENIQFLTKIAIDFEEKLIIANANNDILLKEIAKEYKYYQRFINRLSKRGFGENYINAKRLQLLLLYKYIHYKGMLFWEERGCTELKIEYENVQICFTMESFVHIHRHMAKSMRSANIDKTYFDKDFISETIFDEIKALFDKLREHSISIDIRQNNTIKFLLNQQNYLLVLKNEHSNMRVCTLYPIKDEKVAGLTKKNIADNLFIYE